MKRLIVTLLAVAASAARSQLPTPTPAAIAFAHRIAGCYRLDDGPWRADSVRAGDVSTKNTPLSFELTERVLRGWDSLQSSERPMFETRDPGTLHSAGWLTYWQRQDSSSETILVSYPLPLAGVALTLASAGRDLTGSVVAFTDAIEEGKPGEVARPVRARRVECPADTTRSR